MEVALEGHKSIPVKSKIFSFDSEMPPQRRVVMIRKTMISLKVSLTKYILIM